MIITIIMTIRMITNINDNNYDNNDNNNIILLIMLMRMPTIAIALTTSLSSPQRFGFWPLPFVPTVDGGRRAQPFLPGRLSSLPLARVPVLLGSVPDEGLLFAAGQAGEECICLFFFFVEPFSVNSVVHFTFYLFIITFFSCCLSCILLFSLFSPFYNFLSVLWRYFVCFLVHIRAISLFSYLHFAIFHYYSQKTINNVHCDFNNNVHCDFNLPASDNELLPYQYNYPMPDHPPLANLINRW